MIKNSDLIFKRALQFQNKRKDIMDRYETTVAGLEDLKGSKRYDAEMQKATDDRDNSLSRLRAEYNDYFRIALDGMTAENGKRKLPAPTSEQIALLQVLKMRGKVDDTRRESFKQELNLAANSLSDNAQCIAILNDIARENGFLRQYQCTAGIPSIASIDDAIRNLRNSLRDFAEFDTTRAARIARKYYEKFGSSVPDESTMAKRPLFDSKESCLGMLTGLSGEELTAFCDAVDGE